MQLARPTVPCSRCGSDDTIPISYGYPGSDMWEAQQRGEIVLGGCCITPDQPTHKCKQCGGSFEATPAPNDRT